MSNDLAWFAARWRTDELMIAETKHWVWSLRPTPATLGAGILSLRTLCPTFSDATTEQLADFATITKIVESRLAETFQPDKMNYLAIMMNDPHVHYHVLPRYGRDIDFAGLTWSDCGWPALPDLAAGLDFDNDAVLHEVRDALRR